MFRDWLCTHPDDAALYVDAKLAAIHEICARMFAAHGLL
jgi:hypothetical protein